MEFLTLKKDDLRLEGVLRGTFDPGLRALPVRSFRAAEIARDQGLSDDLTFRLVKVEAISRPPFVQVLLTATRPELWPLTMYPLLSALCLMLISGDQPSLSKAVLAIFAVISLHASVFLMNDSSDHLKGLDAVSENRGSQLIQKGYLTAGQALQWAYVFLGLGVCLGLPVVLTAPAVLWWLAPLAPLAIVGFSHRRFGLKYWGIGDGLIFLCFGPLLTAGFALAVGGVLHPWVFHLGVIWGWMAVVVFHLRSFENLFADGLVRSGTFVSRLGFDRAKKFVAFQLLAFLIVWSSWFFELRSSWLWVPTVIYLGAVSYWHVGRILRMPSPLSSTRRDLAQAILLWLVFAPVILVGATYLDRIFLSLL